MVENIGCVAVSSMSHCANSCLNAFFTSSFSLAIDGYYISMSAKGQSRGEAMEKSS